jgi:hypothetical protein
MAMEGLMNKLFTLIIASFLYIFNNTFNTMVRKFSSLNNNNKSKLIWVYDIRDLSLINKSPFFSKTDCALGLQISRSSVINHLDKNKVFDNK